MSPDYIENPRREPRAPARCRAAVVSGLGRFEAETEDVGSAGCRIAAPRLVHRGEPLQLQLVHDSLRDGLRVSARVAWTQGERPWRLGIAFDPGARSAAGRWFAQLVGSLPALVLQGRLPARIPLSSMVYLLKPPTTPVEFGADELELLRAVGGGTSLAMLQKRYGGRWAVLQPVLFALLGNQHLTLQRGASVHPHAWRSVLGDPPPSAFRLPPRSPDVAAAIDRLTPEPASIPLPAARGEDDAWGRAPGRVRGEGIPLGLSRRTAEAEALYTQALEKLARGQVVVGRALLEQAAAMAPGDPGIAAALLRTAGRQ